MFQFNLFSLSNADILTDPDEFIEFQVWVVAPELIVKVIPCFVIPVEDKLHVASLLLILVCPVDVVLFIFIVPVELFIPVEVVLPVLFTEPEEAISPVEKDAPVELIPVLETEDQVEFIIQEFVFQVEVIQVFVIWVGAEEVDHPNKDVTSEKEHDVRKIEDAKIHQITIL